MPDGVQVGEAYIEITPELSRAGLRKSREDIKKHVEGMAKDADKALKKSQQDLMGRFTKQMDAFQKGQAKAVFEGQRKEMQAAQSLERQRMAARKAAMKAFEDEKRRIAESIRAQKTLADQKAAAAALQKKAADAIAKAEHEAYAMERKRIQAIQKAEIQAYLEADKRRIAEQKDQQRKLADLAKFHKEKLALEKADRAEADKAAKQFIEDQKKRDSYLRARHAGLPAAQAAQYATGALPSNNSLEQAVARHKALGAAATSAGAITKRAMDNASHSMSQLSTRIGLASFQLQLLGGFATTFFTGPAAYGLFAMGREGLKFATSIGYARASMESLLGPTADVERVLGEIRKTAIESPLFNTEDAISYAQKLASVGVETDDLYKTMQSLSNIFLTKGVAGPERASLALMAYTQILSKGAIGMDDLRQQFAEHVPDGIGVFTQAAKVLGYETLEDLRSAFKSGEVSAAELNAAFIKLGKSDMYLTGAAKAAETLGGVWQAFKEEAQAALGMAFDTNRAAIIKAINDIKPVVMSFIGWLVKSLPLMLEWLGRTVTKVREIKAAYDALNPAQKELVQGLVLAGLAAGPAAIAIGIFGTAISGLFNGISLVLKGLALLGAIAGWANVAVVAIASIAVALAYLYGKSEGVRKSVLRMANSVKDAIGTILLPTVDLLIGTFQSLEHTFGFLGLKSEHLAYVIGAVLLIPIASLTLAMFALIAVMKTVQLTVLVISSVLYGLVHVISYLLWGVQQLAQGLSHFSSIAGRTGEEWGNLAESIENARHKMEGWIDVGQQWRGLTEANSNTTSGWQKKLSETDLTVTGLTGAFDLFNGRIDAATQKQMTLEDAINNARRAMEGQNNAARSAKDASDSWNKSLLGLKESIKQNKQTLNDKTRAGQANRDMLKQAASASYEMMLQDIRSGVPMDKAIERHKKRTDALKKEFGKNKDTQKAAQGLIDTYGRVPPNVQTLLKLMGYPDVQKKMIEILAAQKVAANPGTSYSKALRNEKKHWDMEKREGLKGPGYKTGGLIRGPGGPTGDKIPIMASDLEYMIQAKSAKSLGKPVLDYINATGQLPPPQQYAKGGQVTWPVSYDISKTKFPEMIGGPMSGGGMGWQRMMAILRQRFPGLPLLSGYRPGAITSTGNKSYHGAGRAVDIPPRMDVFNWISQNYGRSTKELIFTPAGGRQLKNGRPHVFSGGTIRQDHYDHVHWAYDNGGYIKPNTPFINKTGSSELALNSSQAAALESKIENSDRPLMVSVYVDGVRRDAEIVVDEKIDGIIQALGGV